MHAHSSLLTHACKPNPYVYFRETEPVDLEIVEEMKQLPKKIRLVVYRNETTGNTITREFPCRSK